MHILISGGTGLIGRQLCHDFIAQNHKVSVLSRQSAQTVQALCGERVIPQNHCNEIDPTTRIDVIINLAGAPIADKRWSPSRKALLRDSRLTITRQLVTLATTLQRPPELMISGSAVGYYGDRGNHILVESTHPSSGFAHTLCEEWEEAAADGLPVTTRLCLLRTGLVLSKEGGLLKKLLPLFKWGAGSALGSGEQWMPWIHIQDMAGIIQWIISHPNLSGPINAVSPNPVTNQTFTTRLGRTLSRPTMLSLPEKMLKMTLGEMSELLLGSQRAIPEKLLHSGYIFKFDTLDQALLHEITR
jgi:uncharacterized protein (TIGR01777 family)